MKTAMWPVAIIIINEFSQDFLQVPFIKNKHMIEALPSQGSDEAFSNGIGLRCSDRRADFLNAEGADLEHRS